MKKTFYAFALLMAIISLILFASNLKASDKKEFDLTPVDIGNELWAWIWAGEKGENLELQKKKRWSLITKVKDLSGNGNDFTAVDDKGNKSGIPYQVGLFLPKKTGAYGEYETYSTKLPLLGVNYLVDASGKKITEVFSNIYSTEKPLSAENEFYLAAVCMNTRGQGARFLFGDDPDNYIRMDQKNHRLDMKLDGGEIVKITSKKAMPTGIIFLEIWRAKDCTITVRANGNIVSLPKVKYPGVCNVKGVGWGGGKHSQWDDFWMEFIMCDKLPSEKERDKLMEFEMCKWNIWKLKEK